MGFGSQRADVRVSGRDRLQRSRWGGLRPDVSLCPFPSRLFPLGLAPPVPRCAREAFQGQLFVLIRRKLGCEEEGEEGKLASASPAAQIWGKGPDGIPDLFLWDLGKVSC